MDPRCIPVDAIIVCCRFDPSRHDCLTNDSPIFQHRVLSAAFQGRLVLGSHSCVGSRPANRQIRPTVGHRVMSMCAARPAEITGPMPTIPLAHTAAGMESV